MVDTDTKVYTKREFKFLDKVHVATCETYIRSCPMMDYLDTVGVAHNVEKNDLAHRVDNVELYSSLSHIGRFIDGVAMNLCNSCLYRKKVR